MLEGLGDGTELSHIPDTFITADIQDSNTDTQQSSSSTGSDRNPGNHTNTSNQSLISNKSYITSFVVPVSVLS